MALGTAAFIRSLDPNQPGHTLSTSAVGMLAEGLFKSVLSIPIERINQDIANLTRLNLPTPEMAIKLWHGHNIGDATLNMICGYQGIDAGAGISPANARQQLWKLFIDKTRPLPPLEHFRKWVRQDRIEINAFQEAAQRHGLGSFVMNGCRGQTFGDLIRNDYELLPHSVVEALYYLNPDDPGMIDDMLRQLGFRAADLGKIREAMRHVPTIADLLRFRRRNLISAAELDNGMFANGITSGADREHFREMLKEMPSPADVVRAGARQNWDHARALRWGLDDEYPADIQLWHEKIGLDYGSQVDPADKSRYRGPTWAQIAWRDHWIFPPLHSLYASIRRFRGDPQRPDTWSQQGVQPLTAEQKNDILQYMGIVPSFREHMLRLAYNPLSIRHIRMVYVNNKIPQVDANGNPVVDANGNKIMVRRSRDYITGKMLDNGVSPDDAALVADAMEYDAVKQERRSLISFQGREATEWLNEIKVAYETGSISEVTFDQRMASSGIPLETYTRIKWAINLRLSDKVIKAVVARARTDYFAGRTDRMGAFNRLINAGMQQNRVIQTMQMWDAMRGEGRVHLSTEKVLRALRKGYIGQQEALQRLDNLGWAKADEIIMLDEVAGDMAKDQAQLEKAATQAQAKQAAELKKLLAENEANKGKIIAHLVKLASPSTIIGYLKDGIWTEQQAIDRLKLIGYDDQSISDMITSAALKAERVIDTDDERASKMATNLSRLYPLSKVMGYFKDGLWDEDQTRGMLAKLGYPQENIDLEIASAIIKMAPPEEPV